MTDVRLTEVGADNWRACAALRVTEDQRRWVAEVAYYLCLCAYGDTWHPLAIEADVYLRQGKSAISSSDDPHTSRPASIGLHRGNEAQYRAQCPR